MQMLSAIFLRIVGMGITASFVIVIVMLVRWLLKGFPKSFAYMLWILVAFRLMIPVSFGSDISIYNFLAEKDNIVGLRSSTLPAESAEDSFNNNDNDWNRNGENEEFAFVDSEQSADGVYAESDTEHIAEINHTLNQSTQSVNADENKIVTDSFIRNRQLIWMAALIWLAGVVTLVSYSVVTYLRLRRKMNHSIWLSDNVYESDMIRSPFVMGICSPKIYIPFRLSEKERQCILLHERCHIRRKDYIMKCFAFALVQIYWFHPLVWISYHMMCSDMEMSCDEKVISELGSSMKKEYSSALLAFAANKRQLPSGPLAFGEGNVMNRVKNVLQYQKPAKWKISIGVTVTILTMAACATDANKMDNGENAETDKLQNMTQTSEYDRFGNNQSENNQDKNSYGQKNIESEAETKGVIEHQPAQWAENSMHDLEFYTLDYADQDKIVFHISSGLFAYNFQERRITGSLDLKALNCQEVQTGGECKIEIYEGSEGRLKAVIMPYPHVIEDSYVYDFETKELVWYDASVLESCTKYDSLVSKYDLTEVQELQNWRVSEYVLPLEDNTYGILKSDQTPYLSALYYTVGGEKWLLFQAEQATLPKLLKQDDSFYESFRQHSGKSLEQCILDYTAFYNQHDYAGVCALSTGLEYSDEAQKEWLNHTDRLENGKEISHNADETEYVFRYTYFLDEQANKEPVYITFQYIEGEGWRAVGLPEDDV